MAIDESGGFVKVGVNDVAIGKPLANALYDGNRKLLLKRGFVIETTRQCELLVERGLYRNLSERIAPGSGGSTVIEEAPPSREAITTLEATKIRIGDALSMQSSADAPRLSVKLIGYLKNRGLIVSEPGADGEFVMLKEGQSFIMRFFSGQHAYAFTVTVAKQTTVPFPHLHLSYPREVRGLEIRKGTRVDVDLITAITLEEGARTASGKLTNISTGGGALRAKFPLGEKGDVINVKFKMLVGDIQTYLVFDSIIRAVTQDADPNMPYLYGLQFLHPDQGMTLALAAFVYQKLAHESR
jgi:c-di-GMP-binding flagellar brake protein YcgR